MGYRPENTMPSFEHALELGADLVELDVHLTRDGHLAVIHDETVERTTNGQGAVRELTLAELQRLDAGSWFGPEYGGARIPALDEVLAWARRSGVMVDIEIKNGPVYYAGIEEAVVAAVARHEMTEQVIIISFDHVAVGRVKALQQQLLTGVLYAARPADAGIAMARAVEADALLPHVAFVRQDDVAAAHQAGLYVAPWTGNDPETLRELIEAGVDAIGTNYPDVLRGLLEDGRGGPQTGAAAGSGQARAIDSSAALPGRPG